MLKSIIEWYDAKRCVPIVEESTGKSRPVLICDEDGECPCIASYVIKRDEHLSYYGEWIDQSDERCIVAYWSHVPTPENILKADQESPREAEMREKALKDKVSILADARREGERIGIEKAIKKREKIGIEKGEKLAVRRIAEKLLALNTLSVEQIAEATRLTTDEVRKLRDSDNMKL